VSEPTFSVVICAYTEERWLDLQAAVASVRAQSRPVCDLIVVVDHNEELLDRVHTELPHVRCVPNAEAKGLAGARNTGVLLARGDVVAFLDDDARAATDWLAQLAPHYERSNVIGVGGLVRPVWSEEPPAWWPVEFNWVVGCSYLGMPTETALVRNFIGANMSFRRSLFDAVGGFRTGVGRVGNTPLGCEETELCIRAHQRFPAGELVYEPRAVVDHRVTEVRASWAYFRSRCYAEGRSKALVAHFVGAGDGLSAERRHLTRVLPAGVTSAVRRGVAEARLSELARAAAIVAGVAASSAGYLAARARPGSPRLASVR
jgi:glycosyltransferase involved in cell wall biosynthesis